MPFDVRECQLPINALTHSPTFIDLAITGGVPMWALIWKLGLNGLGIIVGAGKERELEE